MYPEYLTVHVHSDVNYIFLAKISTVSSWVGAVFMASSCSMYNSGVSIALALDGVLPLCETRLCEAYYRHSDE